MSLGAALILPLTLFAFLRPVIIFKFFLEIVRIADVDICSVGDRHQECAQHRSDQITHYDLRAVETPVYLKRPLALTGKAVTL